MLGHRDNFCLSSFWLGGPQAISEDHRGPRGSQEASKCVREPMRASWSQEEAISGPRIPGKALEDLKKALQGFTEQDRRTYGNYPLCPSDLLPCVNSSMKKDVSEPEIFNNTLCPVVHI